MIPSHTERPDTPQVLCTNLSVTCTLFNESSFNRLKKLKVKQSHYRPEVPRGFQEVKVPRLRDNVPGWC